MPFKIGLADAKLIFKRAYGLARCTWRGLEHSWTYAWSLVAAYNLAGVTILATKSTLRPSARRVSQRAALHQLSACPKTTSKNEGSTTM
ncbi:hypothetical protein EN809_017075 [Mesorhizobium sp. M2E.F.Ca.ET.166.01.1.1]|nr:hypothetical protein EN809_017075 [Mesorhizobium sp. M2E.F.Ca.ET.166.01.1.1]TGV99407.1 hypothetical protein EN797_024180 [Mesorhizobium sp. M2E.F.Ca.ET.154.01.1.1]